MRKQVRVREYEFNRPRTKFLNQPVSTHDPLAGPAKVLDGAMIFGIALVVSVALIFGLLMESRPSSFAPEGEIYVPEVSR